MEPFAKKAALVLSQKGQVVDFVALVPYRKAKRIDELIKFFRGPMSMNPDAVDSVIRVCVDEFLQKSDSKQSELFVGLMQVSRELFVLLLTIGLKV